MQFTVLSLAFLSVAYAAKDSCTPGNNCQRAVTGTFRGLAVQSSRIADCGAYQTCTAMPAVTTTTTSCQPTIPAYITTACAGPAEYANACSCAGKTTATVTTFPTPPVAPYSTFNIVNKNSTGVYPVYLNPDGQSYGNVGDNVLSNRGTGQPVFQLVGTTLETSDGSFTAYAYPDKASKLYFQPSGAGAPTYGSFTYVLYKCSLGSFDQTVPGYPLNCVNNQGGTTLIYQLSDGDYGYSTSDIAGSSNFVTGQQFYAVQLPAVVMD